MYLNSHSWFSFKYGTLSIEKLIAEAQQKNCSRLALTDINNTSGVLDFVRLAPKQGVTPVVGIDFRNGARQQFIGIARNNAGFLELNDFLSAHLHAGEKFQPRAPQFENAFVIYPLPENKTSAENISPKSLHENESIGIKPGELNKLLFSDWKNFPEKLVALVPVTFGNKKDFNAHRLLRAMDNNTLLSKLSVDEQAQPNEMMWREEDLRLHYVRFPFLIENANRMLNDCSIHFDFGKSKNKKYFTGNAHADRELLRRECMDGLSYRYGKISTVVSERLEKELRMIEEKDFSSYFLINWDIVRYAQHKNYFYIGRGSGANSMAAYLLRITDVDPIDLDLYFERFINPSRINPPDFDIDFSWKDRDDVTDYIFARHGTRNTSLLATYSTLQSNAVVRELGKVFGLPKNEIDSIQDRFEKNSRDKFIQLIFNYGNYLHDFPAHLSIHAGGILISEEPIHAYTATNLPPKGFPTTQFSMLEAEDVGLYKFDILSQRGLGHIKDTVELVKKNQGITIDIHDVKRFKQDENVKQRLREARCMGCFYIESPAMRMLLKKLEVDNYLGLVAASSIIRPGVARSGMMKEYIIRYRDPSKAKYVHPLMQELMEETFGVMVYQEDVIKVAHHFAGLTLTEADMLRRGMSGKFRGRDEFEKVREKFFGNSKAKGHDEKVTAEVWRQIESFAGYAFSKGHSASYAVESYMSLFLKTYYPKEFMVGVINNFGGFYRTEYYVHEARMSGAYIHAPDVNRSEHTTCIYGDEVFLGFIHIAELEEKTSSSILHERKLNGNFLSLNDFAKRVSISLEQINILIRVGAFRFTGRTKQQLLWDIHLLVNGKKTKPRKELFPVENKKYQLPELFHHAIDDAWDEMEILGFSLRSPFDLLKEKNASPLLAKDFSALLGKEIEIVGYYVTRKPTRTIRGELMMFGTFFDREGFFFDTT
ncbi:MAG: DNA polymerase III subunit alpha, partial [Bacteroidota bacterium]